MNKKILVLIIIIILLLYLFPELTARFTGSHTMEVAP
jgi:competence protein ComGC